MPNVTNKMFVDKMGGTTSNTYIGVYGEIFYSPDTGLLRVSDGVTPGGNPIAIESVQAVYDEDLLPSIDNEFTLGSNALRWKSIHVGPGTIYITDQANTAINAELTVVDGVLKINGANQLQVGQLKFVDNKIESTTSNVSIQIGKTTDTSNIILNRNIALAAGKSITGYAKLSGATFTGNVVMNRPLVVNGAILPAVSGAYDIGSPTKKWGKVHIGPKTLSIEDQTLGTDAEITVNNGILLINGANQLQVGQLRFVNNTIESKTSNVNIQIGLTTATANTVMNRNTVMATGKSFTLAAGTANVAPLKMVSGPKLTTPVAGAIEYDGSTFYATPNASTRGMLESKQIYFYNGTVNLANNTSTHNPLVYDNGVSVVGGLRYKYTFRCQISASQPNVGLFFGTGGTAVYSASKYWATVGKSNYGPGMMPTTVTVVSAAADNQVRNMTNIASSIATNVVWDMSIECVVDVTTSGKLLPLVLFSPAPGTCNVLPGAYMEITAIGSKALDETAIGSWS
jgi:hypothetical protein